MITNHYIDQVLSSVCRHYQGVFSNDNIPEDELRRLDQFCIIVNESPVGTFGSHFIAIYKRKTFIRYFDPTGEDCTVPRICRFLQSFSLPVHIVHFPIQATFSTYCGFYTILFCLSHGRITRFHFDLENKQYNDTLVIQYIDKLIRGRKINDYI
jgi:hypothetical protein